MLHQMSPSTEPMSHVFMAQSESPLFLRNFEIFMRYWIKKFESEIEFSKISLTFSIFGSLNDSQSEIMNIQRKNLQHFMRSPSNDVQRYEIRYSTSSDDLEVRSSPVNRLNEELSSWNMNPFLSI